MVTKLNITHIYDINPSFDSVNCSGPISTLRPPYHLMDESVNIASQCPKLTYRNSISCNSAKGTAIYSKSCAWRRRADADVAAGGRHGYDAVLQIN
ncbi:MAG: hypothetical protein DDT35_01574 [Firmicutes bacterium]|nr:hypothetical protein [Bacillota bacterium]